jgi:hypothetical protein
MWVIVGCIVLVLVGLLAIVRWGGLTVQPPPSLAEDETVPADRPPVGLVVRHYLWYLTLAISAGVGAGILVAGAGGRLVMRLLAVTAGPDAQGRITEADQVVGRISLDGTLGFIVFTGLFFGAASGAAYLLLRRWLPGGRTGGVAFGALLLVLAGTRLEPLRPGNPDFDLVGPGWVSVVAFAALVRFHGMLVAALAGRLSRAVPLLAPPLAPLSPMSRCCCSRWARSPWWRASWASWWCWPARSLPWPPPGATGARCSLGAWSWPWSPWWPFPASPRPSSTS